MSETWKRLLCTWLAALMIISYVPMSVSAEETEQVDVSEPETASETEAAILPDLETAIQTASEETVVASGMLGSGHSWKIMSGGTLRITGSGAMPNFSQSPWIGYVNSITSIIIDPGTTSIGDYAFYELGKVKTAVIPDTVTSIGEAAFCWCEGLTSIDIPGSVRTIGEDAFWCCLDLVSVTFHEGLQTIEREAFQGCRLITELKFPESLKSIGYWAFGGCSDLVSVEIPGGVEKLDDSVFSGCTSLKTVKLHEGLISIGNSGFAYCFALDTILIPGSVQSIGETAFYQCSQLGTVTFTGNPPVIAESAFAAAVATVRYPSVNTAWNVCAGQQYGGTLSWQSYSVAGHNYANTVVAPTCTEWGYTTHRCTDELCDTYYMDSYQDALGHSWNSGVVSGGTTTFTCVRCGVKRYEYSVSGTCGNNARWTLNTQTGVLRITGTGTITVSYGRNLPWQSYISGIRHVIIEPGITGIGAEAFFECGSIETIEIPNTVKSIGMQAFVWCKSLKEVTIPEGVTSLGESTFWGCESLETLNLPSTLKSIGKKMFYRCDSLKTLVIPDSVTFIDELAFWDCGGITQITVPRGVTKLSEDVFNGCSSLHTVYLPDTLTEIGPGAFSYCSKLKNITIPDSVTYLGETAFFGCSSLRNVMIPGGVTKLERGVFYGCSNMGYLYFTGEPPVFAEDAFQGLSAGIRYPSVLRSAWSQHTSQKYAGSVYWYSYSVTGHNYQNTLVAPTCENRGYTRHTCTDYGCNTYYMDTYTDALGHKWNEGSGSTTMWTYTCTVCGKTRTVYTVGGSCGVYAKWSLNTDEGVLTIYGSGAMSNFSRSSAPWGSYKDSIKKVVIRSGITSVGSYAFYEHSAIESVELPDTIRTLGEASFCWAENLRAIHIPEGVTSIPEDCFWACLSMEEISLPSTLKTIGQGAFYSNQEVTQLDLPAGLTDIGEDAFWQCYGIRSVTIPKGVTILRETVFCSCTSLKTVVLHDNITDIQRSAFNDCSSLTSMTLPKNLKSVGVNALSDIKVSSLTFHDQVEFLDSGVLYGASVKEIHFLGDVPEFDAKAFSGYTGTAYYPRYNQTWTASVRQNYGGSITWKGEGTCPHSYEPFVTPPTCYSQGYTEYICSICGDAYLDDFVDVVDHSYNLTVIPPTCTESGYTEYTCTGCGLYYVDDYVSALGHSFEQYVFNNDATCTDDGTKTAKCESCDETDTVTAAGTATGHDYKAVITESTCTEQGYTTHTCSKCGDTYKDSYAEAAGHKFGDWEIVEEPRCVEKGEERRECENCDHFETRVIEATGHNYEAVVTEPTCTEQGYTTHTCSKCGDSYVDTYIDALGHDYGEWETIKEATYEEDGEERRECSRCGDEQKRIIPMLTHSYESVVTAPTCTEKGYTTHTCSDCGDSYKDTYVDALGHSFKDYVSDNNATCTTDGTKTAKCERCDATDTMTDAGTAKGHALSEWTVEKAATCVDKGTERRECANCDHFETRVIDATGHDYKAVVTEPTCTEQGYTTHTCSKCNDTYKDSYVEAIGHSFGDWVVTTEPTCTEKGEERRDCENCDHFETREMEAAGHYYEVTVTDPTCTAQGYTTHTCSKCGDTYKDAYVDALGHDYGDWETTKEATCETDGEERRICGRCQTVETNALEAIGHSYEEVVTVPTCMDKGFTTHTCSNCGDKYEDSYVDALGHALGEWQQTKAPTCTAAGEERKTCENCDHFESREVAAVGHNYEAVFTEPTCTAQGFTTHTCSNCGDSYVDTYIDALGHSFKDYVSDKNATCTADGTKTAKCERCDATDTTPDAGSAKGHALSDWTVEKAATCVDKGTERRDCANCDYFETREVEAIGHDYKAVVTEPTCTEEGYTTHTCSNCGDTYKDSYVEAAGHSFGDWVVTTEPTCTAAGEERRDCENCDHFETRETEAAGHDYEVTVTEPTCTAQGYTTHSCTECGDTYKNSYVDALGHDYGDWETTKEATCEENGQEQRICGNCKESETRILEAIGHDYEEVVTVPTCTDKGFTTHTCANCGDKYEDSYVDALGHEFGEWTEVKAPTCTAAGEDRRDCENCDHFENRGTEAAGHDYQVTVTEPTCTAQGYTTHSCTECGDTYKDSYVDALGHDYGDWEVVKEATCEENGQEQRICGNCKEVETQILEAIGHDYEEVVTVPTCTDKGFTTHTCANCGDKYEDSYVDALGHSYSDWQQTKAPTCTAAGEERKSCENCDHFESREVATVGHNYAEVITDPACIAQGYTTHTCSNCGESFVDSYIDALGHDYGDWEVVKEATYEEDGEERRECSRCGDEQKRIIPMLTHSYESVVTAPTCTEKGYTTHTCSDCGDSYVDTHIDALGHSFKDYVSDNNATCTADGTKTAKCERCDATDTMTDVGTAKGHALSEWTVEKAATCVDKGTERRDCANCDHFETRVIEAVGHNYEAVVTDPTCTEQGYTTHTCSNCGDSYVDTYIDALGHAYGDWETVKEATCETDGEERRICGRCQTVETNALEAIGHSYEEVVTAPTCMDKGFTTHTCANCGDSHVDSYVDALGHNFEDGTCSNCGEPEVKHLPGDVDLDGDVDVDDVLALLWHVLFPDDYPINAEADFDGNGTVDVDDVLTLLWYVLFPEDYPI